MRGEEVGMGSEDIEAVADRLFRAIEAHDMDTIEALMADDLVMWHSVASTMGRDGALRILQWFTHPAVTIRYEQLEQLIAGDRITRRNVVHVGVEGHDPVELPSCIWLTVRDGQVYVIDEYTDGDIAEKLVAIIPR
jgi:ketosteroid isomerase-like protein